MQRTPLIASLLCLGAMVACGQGERVEPPADPDATPLVISQGTQGRAGGLSIGVASVSTADYVDEGGTPKHGPVAGLAFSLTGDPPRSERRQVHAGQTLEIFGYSLFIEEVTESGVLGALFSGGAPGASNGHVSLRVKTACDLVVRPPAAYRFFVPPMSEPVARFHAKGGTITEQLVPALFPPKPWLEHPAISGSVESFHLELYEELEEIIVASASLGDLERRLTAAGYATERVCGPKT